jgi:hypothetical protein
MMKYKMKPWGGLSDSQAINSTFNLPDIPFNYIRVDGRCGEMISVGFRYHSSRHVPLL